MTKTQRLAGLALSAAFIALAAAPASAETLFKIVTVKDDITVGLNDAELKELAATPAASPRRSLPRVRSRSGNMP